MAVFRIYVEKKQDYASYARELTGEIQNFLGITQLENLRVIHRYDVEGIDSGLFEKCKDTIFSDPALDDVYDQLPKARHSFTVEYLPGQYDQRADSCSRCIELLSMESGPKIRTARVYILTGYLTDDNIQDIKKYIINPVESREISDSLFSTLAERTEKPGPVTVLHGFKDMKDQDIAGFLAEYSLAMDAADLTFCRDYFRGEGRDPSLTEIRMIDTYWSDHCRHTTFLTHIDSLKIHHKGVNKAFEDYENIRIELGRNQRPITLMDLATIGAKYLKHKGILTNLDESEEVNACSVKIDVEIDGVNEPWLLMFKNETHNHPTEIEPFGGASTCLGGAIRDPLSGRAYVYQAMRITGAADPLTPVAATLPGKLPQRKLVKTAAQGYSSYGNEIGAAAGLIKEIYHPGYVAKRMEMGAVLAAAPSQNVVRETPVPGDLVILLGGKTGRDGCGGATGSSKSHDESSLEKGGAEVQKGNPAEERKILRLFRDERVAPLIKRCNDFGAGGVSVAVGELADSLEIDLDSVPVKYQGLDGTELAISESQERMAVVIALENLSLFMDYALEENLEATVIARVTDSGRLIMKWGGDKIVDLSREFINSNGTIKHAGVEIYDWDVNALPKRRFNPKTSEGQVSAGSLQNAFNEMASDLNFCSQKGLISGFDSTIGGGTVLMPLGGAYQETPTQSIVAKIPLLKGNTLTASTMSYGFDPYLTEADPFWGSYLAVLESIAKLVACGSDLNNCWLSFQEFFEKLGDDPLRWGKPFAALLGALRAQIDLGIAAIGGKDSMSGSFEDINVPPTLVSVAVSLCKADLVISPEFKKAGNPVLLIAPKLGEDLLPEKDSLIECFDKISGLIKEKKVLSTYALTAGGLGEAIFKMSLGNKIGLKLSKDVDLSTLFDYNYGAFVIELDGSRDDENISRDQLIGVTINDFALLTDIGNIDFNGVRDLYNGKLEDVFPTDLPFKSFSEINCAKANPSPENGKNPLGNTTTGPSPLGMPRVLVPVFPGTTGEYDLVRAIERSGGIADIRLFRNLTPSLLKESFEEFLEGIKKSQVIIFPGGAATGDEPDGAAKFIALFLRNPWVAYEIDQFLKAKDGLILGIGNGFQALVKSGLLPGGRISAPSPHFPAFTTNAIGRHQSMMVKTRIVSNKSPWLSGEEVGSIYTLPISCGEGRFVAGEEAIKSLVANDQVATRYVGLCGTPSMDIRHNPTGSYMAIESITSPDGRIFGTMAHWERLEPGLYKNIPGVKALNLFENLKQYYK